MGGDMAKSDRRYSRELAAFKLPEWLFDQFGRAIRAQEKASNLIAVLALVSLCLIFLVLYGRYRSNPLSFNHYGEHSLALVGSVIIWISGQSLSVAAFRRFHYAGRYLDAQWYFED